MSNTTPVIEPKQRTEPLLKLADLEAQGLLKPPIDIDNLNADFWESPEELEAFLLFYRKQRREGSDASDE